jgi:hypothetical protein
MEAAAEPATTEMSAESSAPSGAERPLQNQMHQIDIRSTSSSVI